VDAMSLAVEQIVVNRIAALRNNSAKNLWQGSIVEMQEQDRLRISQELHDDFGQRLAVLDIQLSQLEERCTCPQTAEGLRVVRQRLEEMDRDLHRVCCELYPVVLEKLGLIVALESLCREFSQSGIRADFTRENCPATLSKTVSLCIYRVVQEALHNVSKHSGAKCVRVSLRGSSGRIEVLIEDSGVGFDLERIRPTSGLGLTSIEERVKRAGGRISIASAPGAGTKVKAVFYTFLLVE